MAPKSSTGLYGTQNRRNNEGERTVFLVQSMNISRTVAQLSTPRKPKVTEPGEERAWDGTASSRTLILVETVGIAEVSAHMIDNLWFSMCGVKISGVYGLLVWV